MANEITLDYDVEFETFRESKLHHRLFDWALSLPMKPIIDYRRSSSGRVHVRIRSSWVGDSAIDQLEVRAHLNDDRNRIIGDLKRLYDGGEIGRLWDFKSVKGGGMVRAGRWRRLI